MKIVKIKSSSTIRPLLSVLRYFGNDYRFRFVNQHDLSDALRYGTDRHNPNNSLHWYDERDISRKYGLKPNEYTFANDLANAIKFFKRSIGEIYSGGYVVLIYRFNHIEKLRERNAYKFKGNPQDALEGFIKVRKMSSKDLARIANVPFPNEAFDTY
jgi:hypothetical protein